MDTTFYEEHYSQRPTRDVNHLKRNMTLDLSGSPKRPKLLTPVTAPPVLSSPDLNLLKLASPELEKLIIDPSSLVSTPTPTQILFPRHVTEEQESYARGFVDALNELHHSGDSSQGNSSQTERANSNESCSSTGSVKTSCAPTYTSLDTHYPPISTATSLGYVMSPPDPSLVKDEPQTVPNINSPPSVAPIDMEDQERIKLERKRQRNRLAASKCRRRKLERIARLEEKVKDLKAENSELTGVVNKLKEQVYHLKEQVMDHVQSGCQIMQIMQTHIS